MADIRLALDEVTLCIKNARVILHGVRRDATGAIADHLDIALPWGARRLLGQLANLDGINDESLDGEET